MGKTRKELKRLVARWHEQADRYETNGDAYHKGVANGVREVLCALGDADLVPEHVAYPLLTKPKEGT